MCWCRNELGLSTHSLALDVHFKLVQLQSFCWTKSWVRFRGPHQAVSVSHCRQGWCWKGSCEGSSQGWEQGPRFGGQEPPSGDAQTPGGRIPWERGSRAQGLHRSLLAPGVSGGSDTRRAQRESPVCLSKEGQELDNCSWAALPLSESQRRRARQAFRSMLLSCCVYLSLWVIPG